MRANFLPSTPRVRKAAPICTPATQDHDMPYVEARPGPPRKELALVYVATRVIASTTPPMLLEPTK